jgi:hypothetical protein
MIQHHRLILHDNNRKNNFLVFNFLTFSLNFQPSSRILHFKANIQNITKHGYCIEIHIHDY